jgi:hypothetical protein
VKLNEQAEQLLREKLHQKLQQMLPHASELACQQFIELALGSGESSAAPFTQLLEESCTAQEIYLALVYCRYAISMFVNSLPDRDRAVLSKHLLIQHDRCASLLITAIESQHEQKREALQSELQREGHDHLLSQARNEWTQEKELHIYNLYHEMPVSTVVEILRVGEHSVTVDKTKELIAVIAASEAGDRAFTRLPKTEMSVALIVEESTGKTVHFQFGEFKALHSEKRREMRVQSGKPDPIHVKSAKEEDLKGKVIDYSASGFGLSFDSETTLQTGDEITFDTRINDHKFTGKGTVVWVQKQMGYCRAGILLEYSQELHLRLGNEVRRREKSILDELRLHGIPDSLTS